MASYTIEDIELIRRKSGISYQEAVSLLDYHNGNVAAHWSIWSATAA